MCKAHSKTPRKWLDLKVNEIFNSIGRPSHLLLDFHFSPSNTPPLEPWKCSTIDSQSFLFYFLSQSHRKIYLFILFKICKVHSLNKEIIKFKSFIKVKVRVYYYDMAIAAQTTRIDFSERLYSKRRN